MCYHNRHATKWSLSFSTCLTRFKFRAQYYAPPCHLPENNKNRFIVHFPPVGLKPSKTRAAPPRCSRAVIYGRKETRTNFRIILHHFSCPHDTALLEIRTPNPTRKKKPHPGRGNKTHHTTYCSLASQGSGAELLCRVVSRTANSWRNAVLGHQQKQQQPPKRRKKKCNIRSKRSRQTDWCPMSRACASFRYGQKSTPPVPTRAGAEGLTDLPKSPPRKSHTCSFACGAKKTWKTCRETTPKRQQPN